MTKLRGVDLFCGSGGFALGMQQAGIRIVRSIDYDPAVIEIHKANIKDVDRRLLIPTPPQTNPEAHAENSTAFRRGQIHRSRKAHHRADLASVVQIAPEIAHDRPDIVFGGPPCQAFSNAGKRQGDNDPRSYLTEAFAILVATSRPRYFVMENVRGLRKAEAYQRAVTVFRRAGYGLSEIVVDASYFGAAQARHRLVLAGCLDETDGWLFGYLDQYRSARPHTVADVLGQDFGTAFNDFGMAADSDDAIAREDVDQYKGVRLRKRDMIRLNGRDDDTRFYFCMPGGADSASVHRTDRPAPTLIRTSMDGLSHTYRPIAGDPVDLRKLTQLDFEQWSQIAGYPKTWDWGKLRSEDGRENSVLLGARQRQLMVANSVPPPLARSIGLAVLDHHDRKILPIRAAGRVWDISPRDLDRYKNWLRIAKNLAGRPLTQELSDLKAAKRLVVDRNLQAAEAELKAFDRSPATLAPLMTSARKAQLRRTLLNLVEFEFYQSHVRSGFFSDNDESYARGDLHRSLDLGEQWEINQLELEETSRSPLIIPRRTIAAE